MIALLLLIKCTGIRNNKSLDFRSFVLFLLDSANITLYCKLHNHTGCLSFEVELWIASFICVCC